MIFQHALIDSLRRNRERTAIDNNGQTVSYNDVLSKANAITCSLLNRGLEKETMVGLLLNSREDIICAMIGIANARCVFVPLDGSLPSIRLSEMIRDLNLKYIITSEKYAIEALALNSPFLNKIVVEEVMESRVEDEEVFTTFPACNAGDSLYVYFTSGSTGKPKGIIGKNSSLLQFLRWEIGRFEIKEQSRFSQFISPYFDAFLRDVFTPLLAGGTICLPPAEDDILTPEKLTHWIDKAAINYIHCVPSLFRLFNTPLLTPSCFHHLKYVFLSGEKIIPAELENWYKTFNDRIRLVNFYGTTETTMIRAYYEIQPEDIHQQRILIGAPIDDTELLVAGGNLKSCPLLVPGDLYIVSPYTSKGYLNAPEQTHERFLSLTVGNTSETIAFKTGDTARVLAGNKVDLLGRHDRQLKLRGIRIEPDEIEKQLLHSGFIQQAIVCKQQDGMGNEYLMAYIVKEKHIQEDFPLQEKTLLYLKRFLPEYMVPAALVVVNEFPLLSNGKIDFNKLQSLQHKKAVVQPANKTEEILLGIWKEVLGEKDISTEDSFLAIGGTSISIMRLIGKIYKEFNVRISLNDLFSNLSIKLQAAFIGKSTSHSLLTLSKAPLKDGYVLSASQERLYYEYEMNKLSTSYNLPLAWKIQDTVDKNKIRYCLEQLVQRHESLRTVFRFVNGKLQQVVKDEMEVPLEEIEAGGSDIQQAFHSFIKPFDPGSGPLMRCGIITCGAGKVLVIDMHHLICDGMSQLILVADFMSFYREEALEPLAFQYKDFAEWEHRFRTSAEYIVHREFWLKLLQGEYPRLALPLLQPFTGKTFDKGGNVYSSIALAEIQPLLDLLQEEEMTVFSGLFAAFAIFMARLCGQEDLVIGINTTGRMQEEMQGVVGMFVKTLPIRCQVPAQASLQAALKNIHQLLVQAHNSQVYDLADIARELNAGRTAPIQSLFDVVLVFQNYLDKEDRYATDGFAVYDFENTTAKFPITLFAMEGADALHFRWEYAASCFTEKDVEYLATQFKAVIIKMACNLQGMVADCIGAPAMPSQLVEDDISFNF
jgi:amino acid adenylation domain-containing protein